MTTLVWDRLMETCVKRDASEIVLIVGYPPMLRLRNGLATMRVPPVSSEEIRRLIAELKHPPAVREGDDEYEYKEHDGYHYLDILYRQGHAFRATVFGDPDPSLLIMLRLGDWPAENAANCVTISPQ